MPANIQIIRGNAPALQIGTPAVPPQTFTSHLPRGTRDVKASDISRFRKCLLVFVPSTCLLQCIWPLISVFLPCRGCCSSCYVQLQNGPAASHWSERRPRPAHSAAHHSPDHSGAHIHLHLKMSCDLREFCLTLFYLSVHSPALL